MHDLSDVAKTSRNDLRQSVGLGVQIGIRWS
jgi:hypothetical protein